jgi:hypothetical protein
MPVFSMSLSNKLYEYLERARGETKRSTYIAGLVERDLMEAVLRKPPRRGRVVNGPYRSKKRARR